MGKALSCGSGVASGEGDRSAKGAVATRTRFLWGDFLPLRDDTRDVRWELLKVLLEESGSLGGGCISSTGTAFRKVLPDIGLADRLESMVFDRIGGALPDRSVGGAGPIGPCGEGAKGPSSVRVRELDFGRAAEDDPVSIVFEALCKAGTVEQTWSPIWEMGISTLHCEHLMLGSKLDALDDVAAMLFHSHCLSTSVRPGLRNGVSGMRSALPRTRVR